MTTPYSGKENPQTSVAGTVYDKYTSDSPQREVPQMKSVLFKDGYWCRNLRRTLVLFCCGGWFVVSVMLAILLILYSQGRFEGI